MSPKSKLSRLLPLGATAAAVGCMVLTGATPTTAAPRATTSATPQVVTLNLVDRLTKFYANETPPSLLDVPVGFMTIWFGQIQNADDPSQPPAGATGNLDIIAKDATTGDATGYMNEQIHFADGSIRYSGSYNRTDATQQKWITISAQGVSGRYRGMHGLVHWRITSVTDPTIPVEEHVVLYGL